MYLKDETIHTIIIEKSRFICYMKHIKSETEFKEYLNSIKKKHYDASHVCSAFVCNNIQRSNDDGEPSGTAGAPILNVLVKNNFNEMCALVVRYFGGIKLGTGGLIRAYGSAVSETIKQGTIVEDLNYPKYSLKLSYELSNKIDNYIKKQTILLDTIYDTDVTYIFGLDNSNKIETIKEYTKGIEPILIGEEIIQKVVE